jgi:hypothetical protein
MFITGGFWNNVKCLGMKLVIDAIAAIPVSFFYNRVLAWHFNLPDIGYIGVLAGIISMDAIKLAQGVTFKVSK